MGMLGGKTDSSQDSGEFSGIRQTPRLKGDDAQTAMAIVIRALNGVVVTKRGLRARGMMMGATFGLAGGGGGRFRPSGQQWRVVLKPVHGCVETPDAKLSQRQQDRTKTHRPTEHGTSKSTDERGFSPPDVTPHHLLLQLNYVKEL